MIDLTKEPGEPLAELLHRVLGHRVSPPTRWRWVRKGVHGVRLEVVVVGGRVYSTPSAVHRFFSSVTETRQRGTASDAYDGAQKMPDCPEQVTSAKRSSRTRGRLQDRGLL